jgi:hypothetical protein
VLVRTVRQAIERKLDVSKRYMASVSPAELIAGLLSSALFDDIIHFCDWPFPETRGARAIAPNILQALAQQELRPVIIFAPYSSLIFRDPLWGEAERTCMVVEEPVVSPATLESVLSYLGSATDVPHCPAQESKFIEYFGKFIEQEGECALTEFAHVFDEALLLHTDASGVFRSPPADAVGERNRSYILAPLRRLVEGGDPSAAKELFEGVGIKYRRYAWTVGELLVELQQATQKMLLSSESKSRRWSNAQSRLSGEGTDLSLVLWAVTLISGTREVGELVKREREDFAPRPDVSLAIFELWVRDFVSRSRAGATDNPIPDLWSELRAMLDWYAAQTDDRPNPLQRLIAALSTHLQRWPSPASQPNWIMRLSYLIEEANRKRHSQSITAVEKFR